MTMHANPAGGVFAEITLERGGGRVRAVSTGSLRRDAVLAVGRALVGRPVAREAGGAIEAFLRAIYALCPEAHAAAWRAAAAEATGEPLTDAERHDLSIRVAVEAAVEHLRCLAFDAPRALGLPVDERLADLGRLRASAAALLALPEVTAERREALLGLLSQGVAQFVTGEDPKAFRGTKSLADLLFWTAGRGTAAARLLYALWREAPQAFAYESRPLIAAELPGLGARGFDPLCPMVSGAPRATAAALRFCAHPVVAAVNEGHFLSLRALYVARLISLLATVRGEIGDDAEHVRAQGAPAAGSASIGPGAGLAWVETARGTLVMRVTVTSEGRLARLEGAAPTEWNFARGGLVAELLSGLRAGASGAQEDLRRRALWVTTGIDPCAPCLTRIREEGADGAERGADNSINEGGAHA